MDAEPVRRHVRSLQSTGMGWKRIAREAGIHASVLWKLLYGCPQRGTGPSKRVRPATAAAVLAVKPKLTRGQRIDAAETWVRIADVMALGYSKRWIAEQLGNRRALQIGKHSVEALTAYKVLRLWERTTEPRLARTPAQRAAVTRSRNQAESIRRRYRP